MAGKGGYQAPRDPSPVSGVGKFSQRTDGSAANPNVTPPPTVRGLPYGENGPANAAARAVPLDGGMPAPRPTPLSAPTERPDEPVTAGVDAGPGPGSEVLPWAQPAPAAAAPEMDEVAMTLRAAYSRMPSPYLRALIDQLEAEGR